MDLAALLLLLLGLVVGLVAGVGLGVVLGRARAATGAHAVELELGRARATLEGERSAAAQRLADLRRSQAELDERFRLLSQEALDRTGDRLLGLAEERSKAAEQQAVAVLEQRRAAVEALVMPLRDSLAKVERQLGEVERARTGAYADLRRQVETMSETSAGLRLETAQLVTALRAPQVRGRWGELQLRRVVEAAGMLEHCDFVEQETVRTPDGLLRPDLVVQLAGGKKVVVDAKVAFAGYLEAMEARDEATRGARLAAHARHLREHISALGAKRYWEHVDPTPEFVVMFVPAEAFLHSALDEDPALLEHAFAHNVVLATPATLVAMLRTVAYTWRQDAVTANAREVFLLGRELHGRLSTLGGHVGKLGSQLNGAVAAYNKAVASLEGRVLVSARRLADLEVTDDELAAPTQVEAVAREVQAPELVASATDALMSLDDLGVGDDRVRLTGRGMPDGSADVADPRFGALPTRSTGGSARASQRDAG